jgi:hypothetical protein
MQATTNDTNKIKKKGSGGPRKGAGRKRLGKKYASYFLTEDIVLAVSNQANPSVFVEEAIKEKLEKQK